MQVEVYFVKLMHLASIYDLQDTPSKLDTTGPDTIGFGQKYDIRNIF